MEQNRLFDLPPKPSRRKPTGTFLSRNVTFFEAFSASETLNRAAQQAVKSNARRHGSDRNAAAPFEDAFKALILDAENIVKIGQETIAAARQAGITVSNVKIEEGRDKTLADIIVSFEAGEGKVSIATNVKRLLPDASHTEGGSILAFLRLALDDEYDPANPPSTRGFSWEQTVVEWLAGRKKIQPGRDYFLLVVKADGTKFEGVEAWPVISGMSGNRPCVHRHTNRAVLEVSKPTGTIEAGFDVNAALATQLLPAANPGAARSLLTSLAIAMNPNEDSAAIASTLLDLSDWQIGDVASTISK